MAMTFPLQQFKPALISKHTLFLNPIRKTTLIPSKDQNFQSYSLFSHKTHIKKPIFCVLKTEKASGPPTFSEILESLTPSEPPCGGGGGGDEGGLRFWNELSKGKKKQIKEFLWLMAFHGLSWLKSGKIKKSEFFPLGLVLLPIILSEAGDNGGVKDAALGACLQCGWMGWTMWKIGKSFIRNG